MPRGQRLAMSLLPSDWAVHRGGALAPIAIGIASERWGLGPSIAANGVVYIVAAVLMILAIFAFIDKDTKKIAEQTVSA